MSQNDQQEASWSNRAADRRAPSLEFRNVVVDAEVRTGFLGLVGPRKTVHILRDVSGEIEPGLLTAIIGPSGAGKTTLLQAISNQLAAGGSSGVTATASLSINGRPATAAAYRRLAAFVPQSDASLQESMTPREVVRFAAAMQLPPSWDDERREARAEAALAALGLGGCADTVLGDPGDQHARGVSGGERRRTSVAVELVRDPDLILLDEPTSGLDSEAATQLVTHLRGLTADGAERRRTVVATIHQPSSALFDLFDRVIVMAAGRVAFAGPTAAAVDHFAELGHPVPTDENPATFMLDLVRPAAGGAKSTDRLERLADAWAAKAPAAALDADRLELGAAAGTAAGLDATAKDRPGRDEDKRERPPLSRQFSLLLARNWLQLTRRRRAAALRFGQIFFFAALVSVLFWDLGDDQASIQNRGGAIFFITNAAAFLACLSAVTGFSNDRLVFLREQAAGAYGPAVYYAARSVLDVPVDLVAGVLFSAIVYFSAGFQSDASKFGVFTLTVALLFSAGTSIGLAIGALVPYAELAAVATPLALSPMMMFVPFVLLWDQTPVFLLPFRVASIFHWAYSALARGEFEGLTLRCTQDQLVFGVCPVESGDFVVSNVQDLDRFSVALCVGVLVLFALNVRVTAGAVFVRKSRELKRRVLSPAAE